MTMRTARNIAIILALALVFAVAPGGGNAAQAILAAVSILFMAAIGWTGYVFYRQNRLTYLGLTDRQRGLLVGSLGAIVLMIAGASELTRSGGGTLLWIAVLVLAVLTIVRVATEARSSY